MTDKIFDEILVTKVCKKRNCTHCDHTDDNRHKIRVRIELL